MASNAGPPAAPAQFTPAQLNALFGEFLAQNLNGVAQTMRRVIPPTTKLTKAEDYLTWRGKLIRNLNRVDLDQHILQDLPEPEDAELRRVWKNDRADVGDYIQTSVPDHKIWTNLIGMGWDADANDPKDTFLELTQYFQKGAADTNYNMMKEFMNIRRSSYDKMESFTHRLNHLRGRINVTEFKLDEKAYCWMAIKGFQQEYPDLYNRMVSGIESKTIAWSDIIAKLQQLAVSEAAQPTMSSVKTDDNGKSSKKKDSKKDDNKDKSNDNNKERVTCITCNKSIDKGFKHCTDCDKHWVGDICWWCHPEKAKDTWKWKSIAIQEKKLRELNAKATAGPLHQQSGVAASLGPKPSNLLFTTNHDDDDDHQYNFAFTSFSTTNNDNRDFIPGPRRFL
ncbi:hypothetical protein N657DRAFT_684396 [Parathielavia appendiculata]|uniref:Uncharacterized protein n=1 Tax=Parathielavia appendiculata TaxID=2587402 RepID=A0AAN6TRP2_9PEZI|nr:hypothetical protein N657DRAFT_684396 [Parathielavia appendiculata]